MPKIKTTLRNLSDLDVSWVSLVDRGANRIPFRIIKREEQSMLNLSDLGLRLRKAEAPAPTNAASVSAIVLAKGDQALADQVRDVLKAEGLDLPGTTLFEDGTVAISADQEFEPDDESTVVRLSENVAVVTKGFEPYGQAMNALPFGEQAAARGYYDSVRGALDTLNGMVMDRLYKADNHASAVSDVQKALADFQSYVVTLTKALPASLFKAENAVEKLVAPWTAPVAAAETSVAKAEGEGEAKADEQKAEFKTCDECKTPEICTKAGACADKAEDKAEGEVEKGEVKKAEDKPTEPQKDERIEKVLETLNSVVTAVTDIKKSVDGLSAKVEKVDQKAQATEEKLAEVTKKAEDAAQVLKTTVVASETGGDPEKKAPVVKSEGHELSGVFDTALLPRNRTRR